MANPTAPHTPMATPGRVLLNVGGKLFMTTLDTLQSLPNTRLGKLARDHSAASQPDVELFFDRNPKIVNSLLDLYRTGELHVPGNLCSRTVQRELEFWGVPRELMRECCFRGFQKRLEDVEVTAEIDRFLRFPCDSVEDYRQLPVLSKVWLTMDRPNFCLASKVWSVVFLVMVAVSLITYCLESLLSLKPVNPALLQEVAQKNLSLDQVLAGMPPLERQAVTVRNPHVAVASDLVFLFFLLDFVVRALACPEKRFFFRQGRNGLEVFLLAHNVVAILVDRAYMAGRVAYPEPVWNALMVFFSLDVMKTLRILYFVKDLDTMKILELSVRASLKVLALVALCMLALALLLGTLLFVLDLVTAQPFITTVPEGMWLAIVTMTTVGYGDLVPSSVPGRVLGGLCAFCGIVTLALSFAVLASKFAKFHDNLACRTQLRARLHFAQRKPEVMLGAGLREAKLRGGVLLRQMQVQTSEKSPGPEGAERKSCEADPLV